MRIHDAELMTVGPDEAVVTFRTDAADAVVTNIGGTEITTIGPYHVARVGDLDPGVDYDLRVDGVPSDHWLPATFTTLERPSGRLLATVATANDVHFGEIECGRVGDVLEDEIGPVFRSEPGEPPYPEVMNRSVIAEMEALDADAVLVKGDLTNVGSEGELQAFLDAYGQLGPRMHWVRGNHDAMTDPNLGAGRAPFTVDLGGVSLAVLDTVVPGIDRGQISADQIAWLDELAAATAGAVLVFGHHHLWNLDAEFPSAEYFGVNPADTIAFAEVADRRDNIVGYFAGHTHRNRVRRFATARSIPFCEIACTKDYPGAWAEYRLYEGGYTQVVRRASAPVAMAWTEKTRNMFAGLYREYALGPLADRCFTSRY
jgi:predicted phosphodiesterase